MSDKPGRMPGCVPLPPPGTTPVIGSSGPGDFVHVPPGGLHGFRSDSDEVASMLILFAPGAPREAYFEGNARFAAEGWPSNEELAAFYAEHDNWWAQRPIERPAGS